MLVGSVMVVGKSLRVQHICEVLGTGIAETWAYQLGRVIINEDS
jgi:hypothetical protein